MIMNTFSATSLIAFGTLVAAETHQFYSGFFSGSSIIAVEFNNSTNTLKLVNNVTTSATSGSKWIAVDQSKKNLYVGTTGSFQSYSIGSDLDLTYVSNVTSSSNCSNSNFIASGSMEPWTVFVTPYSTGCPTQAVSVDDTGALDSAFANVTYNSAAGVHGTSLSPNNDFIYSADDMGNAVWVHSYDNSTGTIEEVQYIAAPTGANPRHLAVHPNGQWVYVVYEEANSIAVYSRDTTTGKLATDNTTYSLLPSGYTNTSSYWADEALFSYPSDDITSPKYLIAATRSRTTGIPGYASAFALDSTTGAITEQLFLIPTTNSGGSANAVSPAPFSENYFAITDSGSNFIEMWQIVRSKNGTTAMAVAHLNTDTGPANVAWIN